MLKNLNEESLEKKQISNEEYLSMFVAAKNIEGCSKRTLSTMSQRSKQCLMRSKSRLER